MTKEVKNVPDLRFPGFENTWEKKKFFDILKSKGEGIKRGPFGGALKKEIFKNSGFAIYEQKNAIYDNQHFRYFIDEEKYNEMIGFAVKQGDIIMSCSGTIGKLSLIPENAKIGIINQALIRFRTNNTILNTYFLIYMRSQYMQKKILESNPGSAITNLIPVKELKLLNFPLPNINEQKKLGSFFCKLDRQIELEEQKLAKLEEQKKGYMQKLFSQKLRFKDENGNDYPEWEEKTIKDVYKVTRGYVLARKLMSDNPNSINKYPVYSSQTSNNGLMGYYSDYLYQDAITWTTDGANAGSVSFRQGKFYCTNVCGVLLNELGNSNVCMAEMLNNIAFKYVSKVGNPKLMNNVMAMIKLKFPCLEEQQVISNFLNVFSEVIDNQNKKVELLKKRKEGLLQKMFV
ncbi:restriction endonuclease subunit S [Staphylococcus equorum]|uniref:restriction endonuclease subunit S n=1 Tax=Staphylococcus equorum TaxID=246432 RepID=UPI00255526A4|nr:restriction endonuclease subunit S [Staphylococcus equorum]MDK9847749.1 restriction endonuclease subunit S [Staphylococcus equorum]